jgi:hypothetical protein
MSLNKPVKHKKSERNQIQRKTVKLENKALFSADVFSEASMTSGLARFRRAKIIRAYT